MAVEIPCSDRPVVRRRSGGRAVLLASAVACLVVACKIEAKRPVLRYSLSAARGGAAELDEDGRPKVPPVVQAQIRGTLEMLFGTPSEPQFAVLAEWFDEGFDPNYPQYPDGDLGSGEIPEEELEAIYTENESRRFRAAMAAIEAGDFGAVIVPDHMIDLVADWGELLAEHRALAEAVEHGEAEASELDELTATIQEEASAYFVEWYPSLRESAELYRQECLHCHGIEGGGNGPTSEFLNPRPRDYRHGVFKFTAMNNKARPRRADLFRILDEGVTGTAMPSFRRYSTAELMGLVDYVRLLSIRGETERGLVTTFDFDYVDDGILPLETMQEVYADVWSKWTDYRGDVIAFDGEVPAVSEEMLARGREIYLDATRGNCQSCHGDLGIGDGPSAYELVETEEGTTLFELDEDGQRISAYEDDWGHPIVPRNITRGILRGGGRPIDIYRRIYAGINGTPMPGIGEATDAGGEPLLSSDDMWALVHYVRFLGEEQVVVHANDHEAGEHEGGEAAHN